MKLLATDYNQFNKYDHIKFTVSSRNKPTEMPIRDFLKKEYGFLRYDQIDTVYGFTTNHCVLYGGRSFKSDFCLTEQDLKDLYDDGIGYRIPLSNSLVTRKDYEESKKFISKHSKKGNTVIVAVKSLAGWIKEDFPEFKIDCSTIKNYSPKQIDNSLSELYDSVVLSARFNNDPDIRNIANKDRVIVFANSKCGWRCQIPTCYMQVSQHNKGLPETFACSGGGNAEKVIFNLDRLVKMGFSHFKLTPVTEPIGKTLSLL